MLTHEQRQQIREFEPEGLFTVEVFSEEENAKGDKQYLAVFDCTVDNRMDGTWKVLGAVASVDMNGFKKKVVMECLTTNDSEEFYIDIPINEFMTEVYAIWREMYN